MPATAQVVLPVVLRGRQVVLFEPLRLTKGLVLSSGRRDLNPRRPPWQGGTLPLSYSRKRRYINRLHKLKIRSRRAPKASAPATYDPAPGSVKLGLPKEPHRRMTHDGPVPVVHRLLVVEQ